MTSMCPYVHTESATAISAHGQISGQNSDNAIARLSICYRSLGKISPDMEKGMI